MSPVLTGRRRAAASGLARYPDAFRHPEEKTARVQLQALLADIEVLDLQGDPTVDVVAVTHDSRHVGPGALFACVRGQHTDGHVHARSAVDHGAVALLVERRLGLADRGAVAEVLVDSTRVALGPVAARFHGAPSTSMTCIGVTGTNGKTTTTYLLEAIASAAGRRVGVVGTTGARIDGEAVPLEHTTPEATELQALLARMRAKEVDLVAMEVSSHALAQHRVDGTRFAAVCFTNLSHDHLDYHDGIDAYFEAKARLFNPTFAASAAVNVDDAYGVALTDRAAALGMDVVTYSLESERADVVGSEASLDPLGARFVLHDRRADASAPVQLRLLGRHDVANALAAAAASRAAGLPFDAVVAGLETLRTVPGRLERVDRGQPFLVLVDYAHTPAALEHTLQSARELAGGHRVILVFGCGGDRDRAKRPVMGDVGARLADVAVVTSDNPRSERAEDIAAEMTSGIAASAQLTTVLDRRAAIAGAIEAAEPGDVVVIAGKGHETGQTIGGVTFELDDRVVAAEALGGLT